MVNDLVVDVPGDDWVEDLLGDLLDNVEIGKRYSAIFIKSQIIVDDEKLTFTRYHFQCSNEAVSEFAKID